MKRATIPLTMFAILLYATGSHAQTASTTSREIHFYSEGVLCYGKLFLPSGYSDNSKVAAVVLAPGTQQTSVSTEKYAVDLAAHGIVAMTFDYRGWGQSGGYLYFGEPVRWDDRLRFSQSTTVMKIRRKRVEPALQAIDIRNAITFLQGEAGVDRTRIGLWGTDLSGGNALVVAGSDARVKAVVAQVPVLGVRDTARHAFAPSAEQRASMVALARDGSAPTNSQEALKRNAEESKLAMTEFHPFWYLEQIATSTAVRLVVAEKDADTSIAANANAAVKLLQGTSDVVQIPRASHVFDAQATDAAVRAATEWFVQRL